MLGTFSAWNWQADFSLQVDQVCQHRDIWLVQMLEFDIAPFDAMNVFDRLYDLLLSDVARVVLFRLLEIVRTQVPDLTERRVKSMKQKR